MENTTSAVQTVTLTNTGTGALTINSIAASGDFAETNNCPISPATLAASGPCTISVTFSPVAVGPRAGMLTITDNASGSPHMVPLSGTGWDFLLIAPSSISIRGGKPIDFKVSMKPLGGFNQAVALACSVEFRKKSTCMVAPPSVTSSDGVTPQTALVTIMANGLIVAPTSEPTRLLSTRQIVPLLLMFTSLFLLFGASHKRFRLGMATAILLLVALAGCGYVATPKGATALNEVSAARSDSKGTVTLTGTFAGVTKTVKVTLTNN